MKGQILFSGKSKKNYLSADLAKRVVMVTLYMMSD